MDASISKLAEYGTVGVAIVAIIACVAITKLLLDGRKASEANAKSREDQLCTIIGNHLDHQTNANLELTVAIKELSTIIREKIT